MEKKEFKKQLKENLEVFSFRKVKNIFYLDNEEVIVAVSTQKSNFEEAYYINYGFLVKKLHPDVQYPKDSQCDISARFYYNDEQSGKKETLFEYESMNDDKFVSIVKLNVEESIMPVIESGISKYFELNPNAKVMATLKLKNFLEV